MTLRNLLLQAYPRSWRAEYGEELAGVLAQKRLALGVVADVLGGAARQHLFRDDPWKICGAGLFVWTCLGLVLIRDSRLAPSMEPLSAMALGCFLLATGAWTVLRKKSGLWESGAAAVKAAMAGISPGVLATLLWGPAVVRHADGSTSLVWALYVGSTPIPSVPEFGSLLWYFILEISLILLAISALAGLAGALLGHFIAGLREGLRET
jgi:hypothetical protein